MLSPENKQFIKEHLDDDIRLLALQFASNFRNKSDFSFIINQIAGRQQIKNKIPSWYPSDDLIYPSRLSLEQCSSEATACYKASLLSGDRFTDLTGGWGVDTAFIAPRFRYANYVEKQTGLAQIASHNFTVLGLENISVHTTDGIDYLRKMNFADCIYLDPARRSASGKKVTLIEDCEPDLTKIQDFLLEKAYRVLIKLSPMLDIRSALKILRYVQVIHVVSYENECKELLFELNKKTKGEPLITCINLKQKSEFQPLTFNFQEEKKTNVIYTNTIGDYLYEPHASILKAGFYKGTASRFHLTKLHPGSHLYTSSKLTPHFPGRIFRVETISSLNKKEIKEMLSGIDRANISIRNFPLSVAELRKKLKLKEGGNIYLFATTLADGQHIIIKALKKEE
ncbi:MAG: SAM-dependent methyltransferase [Dysgonamonadaceae bacterium]|jgi:hypothetical protein|nr:SAM-dependent methyltransferase [Dysgonamonadaceae bacterium]